MAISRSSSRCVAGGALECQAAAGHNPDYLGCPNGLTGFVRTPLELYGARFLLGAAEAGFFPGVIVYLSHWFIKEDRAKAVARFMSAIPIGFIIGGPIAGRFWGCIGLAFPAGDGSFFSKVFLPFVWAS